MRTPLLASACTLALITPALAQPPPPMGDDDGYTDELTYETEGEDVGLAIAVDAEIYAGGAWERSDAGTGSAFELERGEVGTRLAYGDRLRAELRLETVRSLGDPAMPEASDGALLVRGKRAWLAWQDRPTRGALLEVRGGLIPDPWIEAVESGYELRALRPTIGESAGLLDTADLGVAAVVASRIARLQLAVTNGEGHARIEQNRGKDVSGLLSLRLPRVARSLDISSHVLARSGSDGPDGGRNHRVGVALTVDGARHGGGMEWLGAWGVAGDPGVKSFSAGWWGYATITARTGVAARLDVLTTQDFGADTRGSELVTTIALWRDLVPRGDARVRDFGVRAYLAAQVDRVPDMPPALPAASAMDATRLMLVLAATAHEDI